MTVFEVRLQHRYDSGFALDAEFTGGDGVTALFGPSGGGKTTALACIAGLVVPNAGRIALRNRVLFDAEKKLHLPPRKRRIGYVFQEHLLFPHLSTVDNLRFGASENGRIRYDAVVEVLRLGDVLNSMPAQLSGGQKQRVALGRALLSDPELLLMDEPLASLDSALKERILDYLETATAAFRIPTLFVSHSQAEVRRLAKWVVVLDRGKVKARGTADEVLSQPAALELGDDSGPVNLLRLERIERRDDGWIGTSGGLEIHLPSREQAGAGPGFIEFRPRDVLLAATDVANISARNHFPGVVVKIVPVAGKVLVAVDVGQMIWAEVTPAAVGEMKLAPGSPVVCLVKSQSMRFA